MLQNLQLGMRQKIMAAIFLMTVLPTAMGISFLYFFGARALGGQTSSDLVDLARPIARMVAQAVDLKVNKTLQISSDPLLIMALSRDEIGSEVSPYLQDLLRYEPYMESLLITDRNGMVRLSTHPVGIASCEGEAWWKAVANDASGKVYISDIGPSSAYMGLSTFIISVPIRKLPGNEFLGVLKAEINADYLSWVIASSSFTFPIRLTSAAGAVLPMTGALHQPVVQSGPAHQLPLDLTVPETRAEWERKTAAAPVAYKKFLIFSLSVFGAEPSAATFLPQWRLFLFKSEKESISTRNRILWQSFTVLLLLFGVFSLFGHYLIRHITNPLAVIQRHIDILAAGNLDIRITEIGTGDEIETLADSFNVMARKLDLTQKALEKQNAELVRLNQVKSNFVNMVSHELRTPLMIIKESVQLLLTGIKGALNKEQTDIMGICNRNAARLHQIINDLLDISRIEAGKVELNREYVNILQIARDVIEGFRPQSEAKKIKLELLCAEDHLAVFADAKKIDHILTNLIGNAFKFTYPNGTISVQIELQPRRVVVSVIDTGIGIASQNISRIFDKFEKLSKNPLAGQGSTGLGLSIAKEFVRLHKGDLWVESKEYVGSKFSFSLPIFTEQEFLLEYLNDLVKKYGEEGVAFSIVAVRIHDLEKNLAFFNAPSAETLMTRMRETLSSSVKKIDVLLQKERGDLLVLCEQKKTGALLLEDRVARVLTEKFFFGNPSEFSSLARTAIACFPEDAKTVGGLLKMLEDKLRPAAKAAAAPAERKLIGQMLLEAGYISENQLREALEIQKEKPKYLGEVLVEMEALRPDQLGRTLEEQLGIPYISLTGYGFDKKMLKLLDQQYIIENRIVPLIKDEHSLVLAMVNPFDTTLINRTQEILHLQVRPVLTTKKEFYELVLENF